MSGAWARSGTSSKWWGRGRWKIFYFKNKAGNWQPEQPTYIRNNINNLIITKKSYHIFNKQLISLTPLTNFINKKMKICQDRTCVQSIMRLRFSQWAMRCLLVVESSGGVLLHLNKVTYMRRRPLTTWPPTSTNTAIPPAASHSSLEAKVYGWLHPWEWRRGSIPRFGTHQGDVSPGDLEIVPHRLSSTSMK